MSIQRRVHLALAVFGALVGSMTSTIACSCVRPENAANMSKEELSSWRFDHATTVVTGRVMDVHASVDIKRGEWRVVVGRLKVNSVQKGDVPLGDITLLTGFGTGDCGMAEGLLVALAQNRDLTVELQTASLYQREYSVNICGYAKLSAGHEN